VARERLGQQGDDGPLGLAVGLGHEVGRPLLLDDELGPAPVPAHQPGARATGRIHHRGQLG